MKIILQIIPWVVLLLSFVVLAFFYNSTPNEVLIVRSFFGDEAIFARKSLFTVFRVPLIEIVCAAAIELMRRKSLNVNADYYLTWSILLYTAAFKSLFQSLEIVSLERKSANIFFYITFAIVIIGIISAIFTGRKFFSNFFRADWTLSGVEKTVLATILIAYLGLAIVPVIVFK